MPNVSVKIRKMDFKTSKFEARADSSGCGGMRRGSPVSVLTAILVQLACTKCDLIPAVSSTLTAVSPAGAQLAGTTSRSAGSSPTKAPADARKIDHLLSTEGVLYESGSFAEAPPKVSLASESTGQQHEQQVSLHPQQPHSPLRDAAHSEDPAVTFHRTHLCFSACDCAFGADVGGPMLQRSPRMTPPSLASMSMVGARRPCFPRAER